VRHVVGDVAAVVVHSLREAPGRVAVAPNWLPRQELLAALVWAAGDPEAAAVRQAPAPLCDEYRGGRFASAASELAGS
jgi:hypothetical protein